MKGSKMGESEPFNLLGKVWIGIEVQKRGWNLADGRRPRHGGRRCVFS